MTRRHDFRHLEPLRVRWAEIDAQKIVFNAHYLMYLDTAMAGYWRALAMPYDDTMQRLGGELFVRKATLDYQGSARYDDRLDIGLRCARIGRSSAVFDGAVFRGEQRLVGAELVYVFAEADGSGSKPVPEALRSALAGFEAGEAMTTLAVGDWAVLGTDAAALRRAVFGDELGVPPALEQDGADGHAVHALLRNRLGQPLATGRMLREREGVGRIGRLAVHRGLRGGGLGLQLLQSLIAAARERGDGALVLDAQASAEGFYRRAGFEPDGPAFELAGLPHQPMRCLLRAAPESPLSR